MLDAQAVDEIKALLSGTPRFDAYLLRRRDYFMGKMLRFSGVNPWHLRLFRSGTGRCESRLYDQHFISSATPGRISGFMHDKNSARLSDWIASHNRWSDAEAKEKLGPAWAATTCCSRGSWATPGNARASSRSSTTSCRPACAR